MSPHSTVLIHKTVINMCIVKKSTFQTKQDKALHKRTAPAIHPSVPCLPGVRSLLASDIPDWIDHVNNNWTI